MAKKKKGEHKLSKQYKKLAAKYDKKGKDFSQTTQGQMLLGYLKNVPHDRGGNLGAPDKTYGTGIFKDYKGEADRQDLLKTVKEAGTKDAAGILKAAQENVDIYRGNLADNQYFNWRQQLYQANPEAYEKAFPWSSGKGVQKLMTPVTSFIADAGKDMLNTLGLSKKKPVEDTTVTDFQRIDPSLYWNIANNQVPDNQSGIVNANLQGVVPNIDELVQNAMAGQTSVNTNKSIVPTDLIDVSLRNYAGSPTYKPNDTFFFGGGNYGLDSLVDPSQNIISLAGGGMVPGYAGGGIMGINTSKPDYSAFGKFILNNLPQGGVANMVPRIV